MHELFLSVQPLISNKGKTKNALKVGQLPVQRIRHPAPKRRPPSFSRLATWERGLAPGFPLKTCVLGKGRSQRYFDTQSLSSDPGRTSQRDLFLKERTFRLEGTVPSFTKVLICTSGVSLVCHGGELIQGRSLSEPAGPVKAQGLWWCLCLALFLCCLFLMRVSETIASAASRTRERPWRSPMAQSVNSVGDARNGDICLKF